MKVRRFSAINMQKALKKVRDEMGPDAVILSNHRVKGGVEIIVAQNYEPVSANNVVRPYNETEGDEQKDRHLPSPTFSSQKKPKPTVKKETIHNITPPQMAGPKDDNPWPFLSEAERLDVQAQLQLQDHVEHINEIQPKEAPVGINSQVNNTSVQKTHVSSQSELQNALQHIKKQRKEGDFAAPLPSSDLAPLPEHLQKTVMPLPRMNQVNNQLIDDVRHELSDLKEMLMANNQAPQSKDMHRPANFVWKKFSPQNSLQAKLWTRLENMGFEDWLIYQLLHKLPSHEDENKAWQKCLQDLSSHLNVSASDRLNRGGIFALLGPTGAGKTTTIAKMAVRFTMEHEGAKVGLITMDNYRLAAHDQLRTLGQILGVQVLVADQEHGLLSRIEELQECDLVLIDTAGLTPDHPQMPFQLDQLAQLKGRLHTLLTLPATSNSRVLRKVYHTYKDAGLTGCILTKLDEASSLGDAISVLLESNLDLSYCTDGQRIPDDMNVANAKSLVKRAVQTAQQEMQTTHSLGLAAGAW